MAAANNALGSAQAYMSTYGDAFRLFLLTLASDLQAANNNSSYAQPVG